jgi:hypothetical protein
MGRVLCCCSTAGHDSPVRPRTATRLLTPYAPLPVKGEWNLLPVLGMRPPDSCGLGMFLHGQDLFSHTGGAASFFSVLTASAKDGTEAPHWPARPRTSTGNGNGHRTEARSTRPRTSSTAP